VEEGKIPGIDNIVTDSLKDAKIDFERQFILKKLEENEGNISKTAEAIGLERSNLHKKLKNLKVAVKE
jgi:two-component system nitrogen regulation response regulator NtrX